jgi:hypothetical protein
MTGSSDDGRSVIQPNFFPNTEQVLKAQICLVPEDFRCEECRLYSSFALLGDGLKVLCENSVL